MSKIKMMTQAIAKKIPAMYSGEKVGRDDKLIVTKYFTPWSDYTFLVLEGEQIEGGDWEFFGWVTRGSLGDGELTYFRLSQLEELKGPGGIPGVEREKWCPLLKIKLGDAINGKGSL